MVLQSATALITEAFISLGILAVLMEQLPPLARGAAGVTALVTILVCGSRSVVMSGGGRLLHEANARKLQSIRESLAAAKEVKILTRGIFRFSIRANSRRGREPQDQF